MKRQKAGGVQKPHQIKLKKTLRKINYCQSVLVKKKTAGYVEMALWLETKIHNEIRTKKLEIKLTKFNLETLKTKLDLLNLGILKIK